MMSSMAILRDCGVSPEGVGNMSEHTKTHGVEDAWARRHREVNGSPAEEQKATTPVVEQMML